MQRLPRSGRQDADAPSRSVHLRALDELPRNLVTDHPLMPGRTRDRAYVLSSENRAARLTQVARHSLVVVLQVVLSQQ
jgi:hypothetical protein